MNTQALPTLPPKSLQPNPKASATAQSSQLVVAALSTPDSSRSPSSARQPKAKLDAPKSDFASRNATLALIRRVLALDTGHGYTDPRASPRPVGDLLPPMTSSNEVDVELYAIVAIMVKDFVNSWYSKITPDHTFVEEVIQIIAHCSRALEQRLRQADVDGLILDEIPALLQQHVHAFRVSKILSAATTYGSTPIYIYHSLNPHPALSPVSADMAADSTEQLQNEATYRQLLVQGALAVLLPTEDLDNACLRSLVSDIIADLILGQAVAGKVCQGWFLHEAIAKVVEVFKAPVEPKATSEELQSDTRSRLEIFGLLSSKDHDEKRHSSKRNQSRFSAIFWRIMQYGYLLFLSLRFILVGMSQARYLPPRSRQAKSSASSPIVATPLQVSMSREGSLLGAPSPPPVLSYTIFGAISTVLDLSTRMPWLASSLSFSQHFLIAGAGRLGSTNSLLDKFLYSTIRTQILSPTLLPSLLQNLRITLFPNNALGPPAPPPPSPTEQLAIKQRAAKEILSLVPPIVARVFFATNDEKEWMSEVEEMLDCFGDVRMNKYLIYGIVELVFVRLVPELEEKGCSELLAERGVLISGETATGDSGDASEDAEETKMEQKSNRETGVRL